MTNSQVLTLCVWVIVPLVIVGFSLRALGVLKERQGKTPISEILVVGFGVMGVAVVMGCPQVIIPAALAMVILFVQRTFFQ